MKKCKACQKEIDLKATKCPHCQTELRAWPARHPILTGIIGLFVFFLLVGMVGSGSGKETIKNTNKDTVDTKEKTNEPVATVQPTETNVPKEYKSALN